MPELSYREALNQALREEMRKDDSVYLIGEDIGVFEGAYKVTAGLYSEFGPRRVKDAPIAEDVIVGSSIGAAMVGLRPVVEIMTVNFVLLALDQIVNNAAKISYMFGGQAKIPLVIRSPGGGGHQLGAQHSQNLDSWFGYIPGLKVVTPATPADAKGLLKTAIRDDNPVVFLENLGLYNTRGEVPEGEHLVPIGAAEVRRKGTDISIVSNGRMVLLALDAADILQKEGISAEVVDLRSLRPLDRETILQSVMKTSRALTVEEGWRSFGVGAEVAATIQQEAFDYLDAPVGRVGGPETPMPYSKALERAAIPEVDQIAGSVRKVLGIG
jgi:pyruvate dehydrogenase E1 component beta subunit